MNDCKTLGALLALTALVNLPRTASADWNFAVVPNQAVHEGDRAIMILGPGGSLHFVLATSYYASTGDINYHGLVGGTWIDEPLWGDYGGLNVAPAFDPSGMLHFLHSRGWKSAGYQLRLATRNQGDWTGWTHTQVAPAGEFPAPCSIAFDSQGVLHAAFIETVNGDLTYATRNGLAWTFELTGEGPDESRDVFIGLSAAGNPQITYISGSGDLRWITRIGGNWSDQTLYSASTVNDIAAISALTDAAGKTHVAYMLRGTTFSLRYAHQTGTVWSNELVPVTPTYGGISLALDAAGRPSIAYGVGVPLVSTNVRYVSSNGMTWSDQTVTTDGASRLVDLVIRPSGEPVIAIQRGSFNTIMYGSPAAGTWGANQPYCFGDGAYAACPCGNTSNTSEFAGCLNALGVPGKIVGSGQPSISGDTFMLAGSGMPNGGALYFQGSAQIAGGAGSAFGDGLLCVSGSIIRIAVKFNSLGASQYPVAGEPQLSTVGQVTTPGTRNYAVWYRDSAAFCTSDAYNATNGWSAAWIP